MPLRSSRLAGLLDLEQGLVDLERTHGATLAENANHQDCLEDVKGNQAEKREDEIQHVETNVAVLSAQTRVKMSRVAKGGVEGDVAGADEQDRRRRQE